MYHGTRARGMYEFRTNFSVELVRMTAFLKSEYIRYEKHQTFQRFQCSLRHLHTHAVVSAAVVYRPKSSYS